MGSSILFFFYGSIVFFVIATLRRGEQTVNAPLHLHWELYKGSSVYETYGLVDEDPQPLWRKARDDDSGYSFSERILSPEQEILVSPLCFSRGLYLLILWHVWLFVRSVVTNIETASAFGWVWGTFATLLTFVGGAIILIMRMTDEDLKVYYPPIHYVKWVFVIAHASGWNLCGRCPFRVEHAGSSEVRERAGHVFRFRT